MSSSALSNSTETIVNVVFGLTATGISIVTAWQGHKAWKVWREHGHAPGNVAADVELGLRPTRTSVEAPNHEEVVAASAPSSDYGEDVTGSEHMHVSTPTPQLQSTPPTTTTVVGPSSKPRLVQDAQIQNDEDPGIHSGNVQPVMTDSERLELGLTANDDDVCTGTSHKSGGKSILSRLSVY